MILRRHLSFFLVFFGSFPLMSADNEVATEIPSKQIAPHSLREDLISSSCITILAPRTYEWTLSKTKRRRLAILCAFVAGTAYTVPIMWYFWPKANWVKDSQDHLLFLKIYQLLNCDIARSFIEGYSRLAIKTLIPKLGLAASFNQTLGHGIEYFFEELKKQGINVDAGQPIFDTGSALYRTIIDKYNLTRLIDDFQKCPEVHCPITDDGYDLAPETNPAVFCEEEIPPQFKVLSPVPNLSSADLNVTANFSRVYDMTSHHIISPGILAVMAGPVVAMFVFFLVEELGKKHCSKNHY